MLLKWDVVVFCYCFLECSVGISFEGRKGNAWDSINASTKLSDETCDANSYWRVNWGLQSKARWSNWLSSELSALYNGSKKHDVGVWRSVVTNWIHVANYGLTQDLQINENTKLICHTYCMHRINYWSIWLFFYSRLSTYSSTIHRLTEI